LLYRKVLGKDNRWFVWIKWIESIIKIFSNIYTKLVVDSLLFSKMIGIIINISKKIKWKQKINSLIKNS
jgi:hypothetical protein